MGSGRAVISTFFFNYSFSLQDSGLWTGSTSDVSMNLKENLRFVAERSGVNLLY
jgi:hypothetical protein